MYRGDVKLGEAELIQVTEVEGENSKGEKSHLLKLRTGEWKGKILYRWKNAHTNEGVNKRIGNMELGKYFLLGTAGGDIILIQRNILMFSFPFFQPSNKMNHWTFALYSYVNRENPNEK